ncbi:hypothetical protein FB45DRAFT_865766 [Roridomyces roridus]|uniref:Uncharacterized protein n=1 Tax=Roridomyces roridus TaxID=1738132 RepID=A0AAD7C1W3_9AGAR|nr:hypothetical protein FB45DRAFT_865766 [Roridomyces roridus]
MDPKQFISSHLRAFHLQVREYIPVALDRPVVPSSLRLALLLVLPGDEARMKRVEDAIEDIISREALSHGVAVTFRIISANTWNTMFHSLIERFSACLVGPRDAYMHKVEQVVHRAREYWDVYRDAYIQSMMEFWHSADREKAADYSDKRFDDDEITSQAEDDADTIGGSSCESSEPEIFLFLKRKASLQGTEHTASRPRFPPKVGIGFP